MTLFVDVGNISYQMRATAIDTSKVMTYLGAEDSKQVPVSVTIDQLAESAVTIKDGKLMLPPVSFTVTATYGGKTAEIEVFQKYVACVITVPSGVDSTKITTAVVTDNGTERHVPTNVLYSEGKWYARINSLTNSVYALIYNKASLTDTAGKWYKDTVNEMVSRKIINGYSDGTFRGANSITRAEFSAIVIRALGLPANGNAKFTDVRGTEWFVGAVGAAVEYGIVYGYVDGSFHPNANITRQEAMAMVARAAKVAEFNGQSTNDLPIFSDVGKVGTWAMDYVKFNVGSGLIVGNNGQLKPTDKISRAETATVILRLLQRAGLVDGRSKA